MADPKLSYALVDWAVQKPASFLEPDSYDDDKMADFPWSGNTAQCNTKEHLC